MRSLSSSRTAAPVLCPSTSARLFRPMSSMRRRVATLTDGGVSRIDMSRRRGARVVWEQWLGIDLAGRGAGINGSSLAN
ncbi:hypothetical protein ACFDR9_001772 [Janthinobacterium sp. CG_23.3]|uniref:hypothetical protein n=1 Tax=Janthinobacterium sp. CG_23.3 TaxID=3349634 RepID=UPI0038D3AFD7